MGTTYHSNDVGSVILGRPAPAPLPSGGGGGGRRGSHFKLWSASLRRIVLDAVRCGGQQKHTVKVDTLVPEPEISVTTLRSELKRKNNGSTATATANAAAVNNHIVSGSDKLSDLLRLSEFSEKENEEDEEEEVRKKVEALEELKKAVKKLQGNSSSSQKGKDLINVIEGAKEIRKLTKDDSEARTTLALLGAIPPLVALLDSPDLSSQIAALYALLNLGIGNDA